MRIAALDMRNKFSMHVSFLRGQFEMFEEFYEEFFFGSTDVCSIIVGFVTASKVLFRCKFNFQLSYFF